MKKKNSRLFRAPLILCMVMVIVMVAAGCRMTQDPETEHLNAVLTNLFTDLTEEEYNEIEVLMENGEDFFANEELMPDWFRAGFKDHMSEEGFEIFYGTDVYYMIPTISYMYEKNMTLEHLRIRKSGESYEFKGKLTVVSKTGTPEDAELSLEGRASIDEEGLVTLMDIFTIDDIITAIQEQDL